MATVTAELESDAGDEDLPLVETDAWLHGVATHAALPAADAGLTVTLYDSASASLMSFSGTLGADGSVALAADETTPPDDGGCTSRTGCTGEPTRTETPDIEVLAAELFSADRGHDLSLDLAGASTYDVAYATVTITEPGADVCVAEDADGTCLRWQSSDGPSTRTEVFWDDVGSVWEVDATVELANGETVTIPVNSYQERLRFPLTINYLAETRNTSFAFKTFNITASGVVLPLSPTDLVSADVRLVCSGGFCATVRIRETGDHELSLMAYGADATSLPDEIEVSSSVLDELGDEVAGTRTRWCQAGRPSHAATPSRSS